MTMYVMISVLHLAQNKGTVNISYHYLYFTDQETEGKRGEVTLVGSGGDYI